MNTKIMRLALEVAERSIAIAQSQLPAPPRPPDGGGIVVHPGDDVQAAITAAAPGARLLFEPGQRYSVGCLYLAGKPITLACAGPLPERRLTADDVALLPTFASDTLDRTIDGTNAADVTLDGIAFESRSDGLGEIVVWQDAARVRMDRLLIVCGANGQKRAIRGNAAGLILTRSHIANVWRDGQDSQCLCAWDTPGPLAVADNYLEAASENLMLGGSDSPSADRIPCDVVILGNTFTKRSEWTPGAGFVVKNLLELKCGHRVLIARNHFSKNWTDAQNGYALLIKSVNQDGGSPWTSTTDVVIAENEIEDVENGCNISGYDYNQPSGRTTRVVIARNKLTCRGTAFQTGGEIGALTITENEIHQGGNLLTVYTGEVWPEGSPAQRPAAYAVEALTFTNNRALDVPYGIKGDGCASGQESLDKFCPGNVYSGNVYAPPPTKQIA